MANIYLELELFLDPPIVHPMELEEELAKRISDWYKKFSIDPKYKAYSEKANQYIRNGLANLKLDDLAKAAHKERLIKLREEIVEVKRDGFVDESEFRVLKQHFPCFQEETI